MWRGDLVELRYSATPQLRITGSVFLESFANRATLVLNNNSCVSGGIVLGWLGTLLKA